MLLLLVYCFFYYSHLFIYSFIYLGGGVFLDPIFWIYSVTFHINCIVARCLISIVYLTAYQVMLTLHLLKDVTNDAESIQKSKFTT